jgi:hypothetical protein
MDLDVENSSFPLLELELVSAPLWPLVASASEICAPQDASPTYRVARSISSSVGIFSVALTSLPGPRKLACKAVGC